MFDICERLDQQEEETYKKREASKKREQKFQTKGWTLIDKNKINFTRDECPNGDARLLLKYQNAKSGLEIFQRFTKRGFSQKCLGGNLEGTRRCVELWNTGSFKDNQYQ